MPVPDLSDVRGLLSECCLVPVSSTVSNEMSILGGNSLRDIFRFVSMLRIRTVFVEQIFIEPKEIMIGNELFAGLGLDILGGVQFDSHRFNRDIASVDFSQPVEMRIFVLYEGKAFGVRFIDEELDTLRKVSPAERVAGFAQDRRKAAREKFSLSKKTDDPARSRFAELLISDSLFRELRNDRERFLYVMKVARRPGNETLLKSVLKDDGSGFAVDRIRDVLSIVQDRVGEGDAGPRQTVFGNR